MVGGEMKHIQHYRLQELNVSARSAGEFIVFRIDGGADLMENIKTIALNNATASGMVLMLLGTLKSARFAWYNTDKGEFEVKELEGGLELTGGSGSIAMENEVLTPHIHITVADSTGKAYGGHLFEGSIVKEYVEGTVLRLDTVFMRRMFIEERRSSPLHFFAQQPSE